ncbi:MAG: DUF559 domain-containing protein, partial [Microcoleaceae cyanobacterium]
RVDFLLKDARLIIELDGNAYHSTSEQLEKDAIRQRYLSRAGYTVIRFTGREVNKNPSACVEEVRTIYKERLQREPAKYRVIYLDYCFLSQQISNARSLWKQLYTTRKFKRPPVEEFIFSAIDWLHEKSFITVFIFDSPDAIEEVNYLDGMIKEFEKGEVRINTISEELYSLELGEHLKSYAHLYNEFLVVADDPVYIHPLLQVVPFNNGKLLRRGNYETTFIGTELVKFRWQNIYYPIGYTFGLSLDEM